MHILPAYYTTTNTRKRKTKARTLSQIESERRTQETLRKVGYYKRDCVPRKLVLDRTTDDHKVAPLSNSIPGGVAPKAAAKKYSGEQKLLGIATMHKSNLVPVFSKEAASEISKMRRG
jgi:hypothetical protein